MNNGLLRGSLLAAVISSGVLAAQTGAAMAASPAASSRGANADLLGESLTTEGQQLASSVDWDEQPRYELDAEIAPDAGSVSATVDMSLPVGESATDVKLRWFPAVATVDAEISSITVDGAAVEPVVEGTIVTIPLDPDHGPSIEVTAAFGFVAPQFDPGDADPMSASEDALQPKDIGLISRSDAGLMLGHWFPIWVPEGLTADAELDGFGDIANYPAATILATLTVPDGHAVVTSGSRLDLTESDPSITEGGVGLRDFAVVVMTDVEQFESSVGDTGIVVTAPAGVDGADESAAIITTAVSALNEAFGAYPWAELDVVAAPLQVGVGGMEWPGMVWIESTIFSGGVPGMGDLGDLGDLSDLEDLLGDLGGDGEGDDLGLGDLGLGDLLGADFGLLLETLREWTIAHEVGHMWWHSLIGNDSLAEPVVDEPLAQHSACLVERELRPDDADTVCDLNTADQFQQLQMMMDVPDAAANQRSDEFESSTQYGAVVYGKAPLLFRQLEERYGIEETTDALAAIVAAFAFQQIDTDQLRVALGMALGDPEGVDELWIRWMEEAHGAEDID